LVAYSRVALRVHHVSDVLAGAALGLTGAVVAARLLH
jgi:membrane-associated phospholipid phosphatase